MPTTERATIRTTAGALDELVRPAAELDAAHDDDPR
jgi:hypothetical protein